MDWRFSLVVACGLSIDTFILSAMVASKSRGAIHAVLLAGGCTLASICMLSMGGWLSSHFPSGTVEIPHTNSFFLIGLGCYLFFGSLWGTGETVNQGCRYVLLIAIGISSLDAAAVGSTLPVCGRSVVGPLFWLLLVSPLASLAGSGVGKCARIIVGDRVQAYGGMALFSLGAAGAVG